MEGSAMTSERAESHLLAHALDRLAGWMGPGTEHEGIELQAARISANWISGDASFVTAGGDATFAASGSRGVIDQSGDAYAADAGGTTVLPYSLSVDLNQAKASLTWTPPAQSTRTASFTLEPHRNRLADDGQAILLSDDDSTDDAGYVLSFILL
jgi:hypothetical protein